jgi:hypothetical protein
MNIVLPSSVPLGTDRRLVQPLWHSSLGWFIACVATVTVAAASMPQAGWARAIADAAPQTPVPVAAAQGSTARSAADARLAARCQTCGVVEIVRTLHGAGAAPAGYELTVRFRDGSRRISSHSDAAGWRVGDSIMLVGGAKLADRVL